MLDIDGNQALVEFDGIQLRFCAIEPSEISQDYDGIVIAIFWDEDEHLYDELKEVYSNFVVKYFFARCQQQVAKAWDTNGFVASINGSKQFPAELAQTYKGLKRSFNIVLDSLESNDSWRGYENLQESCFNDISNREALWKRWLKCGGKQECSISKLLCQQVAQISQIDALSFEFVYALAIQNLYGNDQINWNINVGRDDFNGTKACLKLQTGQGELKNQLEKDLSNCNLQDNYVYLKFINEDREYLEQIQDELMSTFIAFKDQLSFNSSGKIDIKGIKQRIRGHSLYIVIEYGLNENKDQEIISSFTKLFTNYISADESNLSAQLEFRGSWFQNGITSDTTICPDVTGFQLRIEADIARIAQDRLLQLQIMEKKPQNYDSLRYIDDFIYILFTNFQLNVDLAGIDQIKQIYPSFLNVSNAEKFQYFKEEIENNNILKSISDITSKCNVVIGGNIFGLFGQLEIEDCQLFASIKEFLDN